MKYTIAIHGAPYESSANQHALQFAKALLAAEHQIERVFFYHGAVYSALNSTVPPQGEFNATAEWQALASKHEIELAVCIANGIKRGVLSAEESSRYEKTATTLANRFELVGLGQLIDAIANSERYVEFPA